MVSVRFALEEAADFLPNWLYHFVIPQATDDDSFF
jgi:hypothetical protein